MASRLGGIRPKEFIRKVQKAGFKIDHQKGSHVTLINDEGRRIVVPYHAKEMKRGLMFGLIKRAGLTVKEFKNL